MKHKSKLFYLSAILIVISIALVSYSLFKIYTDKTTVEENLNLWNSVKNELNTPQVENVTAAFYENGLIGEIQIPALKATIPLIEGSTEEDLKEGAVHFSGTTNFGDAGNSLILGHRDGVFKILENLEINDEVVVETLQGSFTYTIEKIKIVKPTDPLITQMYDSPVLTLVTCYPFHYFGSAPDRYIAIGKLKAH